MREEEDRKPDAKDEELPIEKYDTLAMWLSGLLVIGLPCLVLLGIIAAVTLLLFG